MQFRELMRSTPLSIRRLVIVVGVAALGAVASCVEPVAVEPAQSDSISGALKSASAGSRTGTVDFITVETRHWDSTMTIVQTSAAAVATFDSLPISMPGYTNAPVAVSSLACCLVRNSTLVLGGANTQIATRYRVGVSVPALTTVSFRIGPDFGAGGVLLVDGAELDVKWTDFHFISWKLSAGYLEGRARLSPGAHVFQTVGFEPCCDAPVQAQIDFGGGWQDVVAAPPVGYTGVAAVEAITVDTRYWDSTSTVPTSGAAAIAAFDALPMPVAGYSNGPLPVASLACCDVHNASLVSGGSNRNIATRYRITMKSVGTSLVTVRMAPDFGGGGVMRLDSTDVAANWYDFWGGGTWDAPARYLQATVILTPGTHLIQVVGFEKCCDAAVAAQFKFGTTDWQDVAVLEDVTKPTVTCVASPNALLPPNHKMVDISVAVTVTDAGSGPAGFVLVNVESNEPDDAVEPPGVKATDDVNGDGNTMNDIQGWTLGAKSVTGQLRAERAGKGTGRIYTLTYRGFDLAGNWAENSCVVTVPR